jgi:hypothetical protein
MLPVIWSMGSAEWNIVRLRRRSFDLLNESVSIRYFQLFVRRLATRSIARYLTELTVLSLVLLAAVRQLTGTTPSTPVLIGFGASWLLGCGFFLALVLSSLGQMRAVVVRMVAAVAVGLACIAALHVQPTVVAAPLVLCLALLPALRLTIGDPIRHM